MEILPANPNTLARGARVIKDGALVVFPTDTVYGVGCDPYNVAAIQRVYRAKGRELTKALPLLLSDVGRIEDVARDIPDVARALGSAFWPGALTLVVWRRAGLPSELGGGETIAVRVPDYGWARDFIRMCGGALATTSANLSGLPDALDAEMAASYFGDTVDLIVDGGVSGGAVPSTVVDCTVSPPRVLRAGAISDALIYGVVRDGYGGLC